MTSKEIVLDGVPHQIVGVMPSQASVGGGTGAIWVPLELDPEQLLRGMHVLAAFARLGPDVSLDRAQEELTAVMAQLEKDYPDDNALGALGSPAYRKRLFSMLRTPFGCSWWRSSACS